MRGKAFLLVVAVLLTLLMMTNFDRVMYWIRSWDITPTIERIIRGR